MALKLLDIITPLPRAEAPGVVGWLSDMRVHGASGCLVLQHRVQLARDPVDSLVAAVADVRPVPDQIGDEVVIRAGLTAAGEKVTVSVSLPAKVQLLGRLQVVPELAEGREVGGDGAEVGLGALAHGLSLSGVGAVLYK